MSEFTDKLEAWRAFLEVANMGTVSEAALNLDSNASRVSRLISGLEKELNLVLFDKSTRPFKLSPAGRIVFPLAKELVAGFDTLDHFLESKASKTLIRLAAPLELARHFYSSYLVDYTRRNPDIQFTVFPEVTEKEVKEGKVDIAVLNHFPKEPEAFNVRHILTVATVALATPEYIRIYGEPKTPEDLRNHSGLLLSQSGNPPPLVLNKRGEASRTIIWKKEFTFNDQMTIKDYLLAHQGITLDLHLGHARKEIKSGQLIPILPGWSRTPWEMCIITKKGAEERSPGLKKFADWWLNYERPIALKGARNLMKEVGKRYQHLNLNP